MSHSIQVNRLFFGRMIKDGLCFHEKTGYYSRIKENKEEVYW
jgi:hypothetical protein